MNKKTKFRSITFTLIVVFTSLFGAILLIVNSFSIFFNYQSQKQSLTNEQRLIAEDAGNAVKNFIQEKINLLNSTAKFSNLVNASEKGEIDFLEKLLGADKSFRQLIIAYPDRENFTAVSRLSEIKMPELVTPEEKERAFSITKSGDTYISPIYIDEITNEPLIAIAVPIKNIFGDSKEMLIAETNLKFMWDLVNSIKIGNEGLVYVVDKKGRLIAFNDTSRILKGENLTDSLEEVNEFVNGTERIIEEAEILRGISGDYVVTTMEQLGQPDWAVIIEVPIMEAYAPIINTSFWAIFLTLVGLTINIIITPYLSKRITKPIEILTNTAVEIGKGNLNAKADISSNNEIGQLATTLNLMAERLGASYGELELEKARLLSSINSLPLGFILLDANYQLFLSNEYVSHLFEFGEKNPFSFQEVENKVKNSINLKSFYEKAASSGKIVMTDDVRFGSKFLKLFFTPVMSASKIAGIVILIEDITQEKLLDEARNSFVTIAAHELRTPLAIIRGNSELLLESPALNTNSGGDSKEMVKSINKSSIRLLGIINDFLDLAIIESGHIKLRSDSFDLSEVAKEVTDSLKPQADFKNLFIKFSPPERAETRVVADRERTKQVIINLVSNALQYTEKGGVTVEILKEKDSVKLSVSDTGMGIKPEDQSLLFQKFQTVNGQFMHSKEYGSGMGLYIGKLLMESMKGSIKLEKSEPEKGSIFTISLPLA
ncbi:MAG: ATP-binding protein [Candidatus Paceibacterota bacterium]